MKRIMSIVLAVALVAVMTVSVCAVDTSYIHIQPQVWAQDTPNYAVWTPLKDATGVENQIGLGETKTVVYTGEAWKTITTADGGSYQYGIQILDGTIGQTQAVIGDKTTIKYEISDVTIKATGYDDYVVPCSCVYEAALEAYDPYLGGIAGNTHVPMAFDFTTVAGGSDGASLEAYIHSIETVTFTITYLEYNGEGPAVEDTPAVEEPVEETPAVEETPVVEDTPAEEEPADTGLALAVVPMIVAAAAVVLSKKR